MSNETKAHETTSGLAWIAARLINNKIQLAISERHSDINTEQLTMLMELAYEDGIRPTTLAKRMTRSKGTISSLIRHATKNGLIATAPDPTNKNAKRIHLTIKGKEMHDELMPVLMNILIGSTEGIDPADLEATQRVMTKIIKTEYPEFFEY
ncbi:MarR family winged helix-turn-helix transcriptional regulator [Photobacterium satsumensis]|uniref:MarR family winged helix-turn-helix transcriptional regulator n=1 Tax=Photobacterium satsumensis TaxID=2910239 RepID=UPI003D0E1983